MDQLRAFEEFRRCTQALVKVAVDGEREIRAAVDRRSPIPDGCPSHQAYANLLLSQQQQKLEETQAALARLRESIASMDY